jgi:orotate phosphoribosyltransferase
MTTIAASLPIALRRAIATRTEQLFRDSAALREGHFALKSGRHADRYLEKFRVLQYPDMVTELCGRIAARVKEADGRSLVDVVAGPTTGGVILAFETARQLGVRGIFAEEVHGESGSEPRREFRRGFRIDPGERVLLVDDILTTGGSLRAMVPAIEAAGGEIALTHVLVDRSGSGVTVDGSHRPYPVEALWALDLPTWDAGSLDCPGCAAGLPLQIPGASGTADRAR